VDQTGLPFGYFLKNSNCAVLQYRIAMMEWKNGIHRKQWAVACQGDI
jgi:hypothetical protein